MNVKTIDTGVLTTYPVDKSRISVDNSIYLWRIMLPLHNNLLLFLTLWRHTHTLIYTIALVIDLHIRAQLLSTFFKSILWKINIPLNPYIWIPSTP